LSARVGEVVDPRGIDQRALLVEAPDLAVDDGERGVPPGDRLVVLDASSTAAARQSSSREASGSSNPFSSMPPHLNQGGGSVPTGHCTHGRRNEDLAPLGGCAQASSLHDWIAEVVPILL